LEDITTRKRDRSLGKSFCEGVARAGRARLWVRLKLNYVTIGFFPDYVNSPLSFLEKFFFEGQGDPENYDFTITICPGRLESEISARKIQKKS
jgi:hypothetical protein